MLTGEVRPTRQAVVRIQRAIEAFKTEDQDRETILSRAKTISDQIGLRNFAKLAEVDAANLSHWIRGKRNLTAASLDKLQIAVSQFQQDRSNS